MDGMWEIVNSFCKEAKFGKLEGNTCVAKEWEYVANEYDRFFQRSQNYNDAIEVDKGKLPSDGW